MSEQFRPQPENQKPNAPEPAAGPLGIPPPPDTEAAQGSKSPERQPLPSASDILERRAQLYERRFRDLHLRHHESKHTRDYLDLYREHRENVEQLGDEAARLYAEWSDRDRLIFDLYTTSKSWNLGFSPEETQPFIAKVAPMSEEELAEELRKARAAVDRKTAITKKMLETRRRNQSLTPEEREKRRQEEIEKLWRSLSPTRQKRKERQKSQPEQSMQVFPDRPKE